MKLDYGRAIKMIRENWRELLPEIGVDEAREKVNGEASYICPLCQHGSHGDGLTFNPRSKDGNGLKCFGCDFSGDIIDLYCRVNGVDIRTALHVLGGLMNIEIETYSPDQQVGNAPAAHKAQKAQEAQENTSNYGIFYKECSEKLNDPAALAYLKKRGISVDVASYYQLGYDPVWKNPKVPADTRSKIPASPRIIIPVSDSFYIARDIRPDSELDERAKKYKKMNVGAAELFNIGTVYGKEPHSVFITEGVFDALSIIEAGGAAVALNSTANAHKLLSTLSDHQPPAGVIFILCLDNDEAGKRAAGVLADGLARMNCPFISANVCGGYKDPNEALTGDRGAFFEAVKRAQIITNRPDNVLNYIKQDMAGEIERFKVSKKRTGFMNLDMEAGGLYPGLYVIAAISSLGKTTFSAQMADQLAAAGNDVIFFSLEQSRLEMVSKSLARESAKIDRKTSISSLAIRNGITSESLKKAAAQYSAKVGDRLSIVEGNFSCDLPFIGQYVRGYISRTGKRPVVFIDYLQILQGTDPTGRQSTKDRVDMTVTELKRMSRDLGITVIVISSVNRQNYLTPIDFESLKESGGIEYTADVIWGLQLNALNDQIFNSQGDIKKKREKVREAKKATPRLIDLLCLKNRFGISSFSCHFKYYPALDLFEEAGEELSPIEGWEPETDGKKAARVKF